MAVISKENVKKKPLIKIGIGIAGFVLLYFVGLFFFNNWLENKIESKFYADSNGVNKLQLFGFQVSPLSGNISVDSISLKPDFKRWQQLQDSDTETSRTLINLHARKAKLSGLNTLGVLTGKKVKLKKIYILQPELLLTIMRQDTTEQHKPLYQTVKGLLKGIQVKEISIANASMLFRNKTDTANSFFAVRQFDMTMHDFKLDRRSFRARDRAYYAKNVQMTAKQANYLLPDNMYRMAIDSIKVDTEEKTLLIRMLKLLPEGTPSELARKEGKSITYHKAQVKEVKLTGVDYHAHSEQNSFIAKQLLVLSPTLSAYKDKKNFANIDEEKQLPHEMVQRIKPKFLFDSIMIKKGFIRYDELAAHADEPGHVTFQNLNATITNLSNVPGQITLENPAVIQAHTMVMGKASLQLQIRVPLLNKNCYHTISGKLGETNPEILNNILAPTSLVSIKNGYIREANFDIELTKARARGSMQLIYEDFKIDILSKDEEKEQSFGKKILSKVVNWVAIKENNTPSKEEGEGLRIGKITVDRENTQTVFSYWKDCMVSGLLSSAGLENKAEK